MQFYASVAKGAAQRVFLWNADLEIASIITGLKISGISILLTDHRERETLTITDRSYIICNGQVLVSGDAETVLNDPGAQEAYFGKRFDAHSIIESKETYTAGHPSSTPSDDGTDDDPRDQTEAA